MENKDLLIYVGQKAFIDKNGEILVLMDSEAGLDLPGGKIQEGEKDFIASLKREVREETDLEIEVGEPFLTWYYEFGAHTRNAGKKIYIVGYKCKYLSGELKLSDEHVGDQWVNKDNFRTLKDRNETFEALEEYFKRV